MFRTNISSGQAKVIATGSVHSFVESVSDSGKRSPGLGIKGLPTIDPETTKGPITRKSHPDFFPHIVSQPIDIELLEGDNFLFRVRFIVRKTDDKKTGFKSYPSEDDTMVFEIHNPMEYVNKRVYGEMPMLVGSDNNARHFYLSWNIEPNNYNFRLYYTVFVLEGEPGVEIQA